MADADQAPTGPLLDHLDNVQTRPDQQLLSPPLACAYWIAKYLQDAAHIGFEAIHRKQDRLAWSRRRAHVLDYRSNQPLVGSQPIAPQSQRREKTVIALASQTELFCSVTY